MARYKTAIVELDKPDDSNIILGISHFIKTAEDLYEAMVNSTPSAKFGLAFCESSGPCLVRKEGNDALLVGVAVSNALKLSCGHSFVIVMRGAYPVNVLRAIKQVPEVCSILCATANPVQVVVAETGQGRGILGVVDGFKSKGTESTKDREERRQFLRKIGYKLG